MSQQLNIPTISANIILTPLETKNALRDSANNGKAPCPSWTIQFARKIPSGRSPLANSNTNIKCGPDCGMSPIKIAIISTMNGFESMSSCMLM